MTAALPAQLPFDLPHRASHARDDVIVTDANRLAVSAIDSWPDWRHPVLLVTGPAGSGKSHLAAAWSEMADAGGHPDAIRKSARPFAIAIDDIDGGAWSEAALFEAINAARLGGGFVLATARNPVAGMGLHLPDLRSRLAAATTVAIGAPDDALLTGVLAKLFADRQMAVDPRLVHFLALRMERSLDAASRLVAEIDRETLASKEKPSRALMRRVLDRLSMTAGDVVPEEAPAPSAGAGRTGGCRDEGHAAVVTIWDRPEEED